jgi:folate-binding protein YgfZ
VSCDASVYEEYRERGGFADLSARTKLLFTGDDRVRYLNGQVTANVTKVRPGESLRACVTTAKGKLDADVVITALGEGMIIDAAAELREALALRLERYIIADHVVVTDVTDDRCLYHVIGGTDPLPEIAGAYSSKINRFGIDGTDIWTERGDGERVHAALGSQRVLLPPELIESIRLENGVPAWGHELSADTLPPEAGLDRTHVDYHKGCYIGQEVVSRLKSVGHVNRQLHGFTPKAETAPLVAGMRIFASGAQDKQLGVLTSAGWSFALAKPIALGYLRRGSPSDDLIALPADADSPAVQVAARELPFTP